MYKTIVVYVDGRPQQASRVRAAALLANQYGAHLVGSAATGMASQFGAPSVEARLIEDIAAALPLLQAADSVTLALVNPDQLSELHGGAPGADMAVYLARHGVKVDVVVERTRSTAGEALMAMTRDCGAGLMVSGACGHSRFREWVLGGVTRELLERAPVPLLLAH